MKTQATWREFIQSLIKDYVFHPPATLFQLKKAEFQLGILLPAALKQLLQETNGVEESSGMGVIWSIEKIVNHNLDVRKTRSCREIYMPFDHLLFFADAGNGDQFAFPIVNGQIRHKGIYVWNHEDDSRSWVAPSLDVYLEWWLGGVIKT